MEIRLLGPLRVRVVTSRERGTSKTHEERAPLTCVFLHGFGAPGDDLVGLADSLGAPPGTNFIFPEGLHSLADFAPRDAIAFPGLAEARAWWMIDMAAVERAMRRGEVRDLSRQVPEGLAEARAALSEMLDALATESPLDEGASRAPGETRLVLGGFSQGAMLALDLALHEPARSIAGLVLLSGTLLAESEWAPRMAARKGTPVFQSHGRADPILPFAMAERLSEMLADAGLAVTFDPFSGPHTITPQTMTKLGRWLEGR